MKLNTSEMNCRKTTAHLDEAQIKQLLATAVAKEASIDITLPHVGFAVVIDTRERAGLTGLERYATVTITEDFRRAPLAPGESV